MVEHVFKQIYKEGLGYGPRVFTATFNNISVISWRLVLLVEEIYNEFSITIYESLSWWVLINKMFRWNNYVYIYNT